MVIGNGMMATAFKKEFGEDIEVTIFASGVANSKETSVKEYERESELLQSTIRNNLNKLIVYFSTCSVYDPSENESMYVKHKLSMEKLVKSQAKQFLICRISNVVGNSTNKFVIFPYLVSQIRNGFPFELWKHSVRNIIDVDDVLKCVGYLISNLRYHNEIVNVANKISYSILELVAEIESFLGIAAKYTIKEKGSQFVIKCDTLEPLFSNLGVNFEGNYINTLLNKYFHE